MIKKWMKSLKKKPTPRRLTLRGWAILENISKRITTDVEGKNWQGIPDSIFEVVKLTTGADVEGEFWMDVIELYTKAMEINSPTVRFPVLTSKEKSKPMPWEYDGRAWYFWLNLFAGKYGWQEEEVGELDIDTCIGLYQEILIDEQMSQEWEYGLSEIAYPYNPSTKKSRFQPLARPMWMNGIVSGVKKPVETIRIRADMLPVGNIVTLG